MAVRKGRAWGSTGGLPERGVVVADDTEARRVVSEARRRGDDPPPLGLLGGDLCRTLGGRGDIDRLRSADATAATVDLGSVLIDGRLHWFVAHLVARRSWLRGRVLGVLNAQWLGDWNVAPRAHPGDGRLEFYDVTMSVADRLKARSRLATGTHLPHDDIAYRRVSAVQLDLDPATSVWLDGERVATSVSALSVRLEVDALEVYV